MCGRSLKSDPSDDGGPIRVSWHRIIHQAASRLRGVLRWNDVDLEIIAITDLSCNNSACGVFTARVFNGVTTLVAPHGGKTMDVRVRPLESQVERIRRIQDHGLGCAGLLDQMSEDEEKVVH